MPDRARSSDGVSLRGGIALWYSQERIFEDDDLADIGWLGGVPDDEREPEEGIEAPPRSTLRTLPPQAERQEETLPDVEELWQRELDR